ncbi:hypothetical protein SAMN02745108_01542 [Fibrobacter intestinalis]|uniref:Uncharacterized protein n=1 Tax=Fibrobacter intestinalis TaxID=28122 RepID=A0A1T4NB90_9BACT|nr:hypothetical protein BGW94_2882 [Fibrobacter sp. NR9]SJZ76395.1 hypothetical protein SAMN02745108_01542 [Fibrobacter intestinalis]
MFRESDIPVAFHGFDKKAVSFGFGVLGVSPRPGGSGKFSGGLACTKSWSEGDVPPPKKISKEF